MDEMKNNAMIAGIGGASLGTEIAKCLKLAGRYNIFGCDIASHAYGLYDDNFEKTFLVSEKNYIRSVIDCCLKAGCGSIIPGGEAPQKLINGALGEFADNGIKVIGNSHDIVDVCTNKVRTFDVLKSHGIPIPESTQVRCAEDLEKISMPCIIKPACNSGGSVFTFYAGNVSEAFIYAQYILNMGGIPLAQEYISADAGEFTVGVLSLPDLTIVGSIALKRDFTAKLSVSQKHGNAIISSGYSQGYIDHFPEICGQAEKIAGILKSRGPINVQGRIRNGVFVPFEINPRFSASTYLRALAGFNETDIFLRYVLNGERCVPSELKTGWYLRSLTENYIPLSEVKQ